MRRARQQAPSLLCCHTVSVSIWTRRNPPPPTSPQCENARSPQSPLTTPHAILTVLACVRVETPAMMQGLAEACQGRTFKTSPRAPWARPARLIQDTSATLTRKLHDCVFFINIGAPTRCLPSKETSQQNRIKKPLTHKIPHYRAQSTSVCCPNFSASTVVRRPLSQGPWNWLGPPASQRQSWPSCHLLPGFAASRHHCP